MQSMIENPRAHSLITVTISLAGKEQKRLSRTFSIHIQSIFIPWINLELWTKINRTDQKEGEIDSDRILQSVLFVALAPILLLSPPPFPLVSVGDVGIDDGSSVRGGRLSSSSSSSSTLNAPGNTPLLR